MHHVKFKMGGGDDGRGVPVAVGEVGVVEQLAAVERDVRHIVQEEHLPKTSRDSRVRAPGLWWLIGHSLGSNHHGTGHTQAPRLVAQGRGWCGFEIARYAIDKYTGWQAHTMTP